MAIFTKDNQPANRGRKKGSLGKKATIPDELQGLALAQLTEAVKAGESYAVTLVVDRIYPKLRPIASGAELSLLEAQTELTRLKSFEISELQTRIEALEAAANDQ